MRKSIGLALMILGLWVLGLGRLWAEKPRRYIEAGFMIGAGFANNYLGYGDFFNDDHVIRIDFNSMGSHDFNLVSDVAAQTFFNVNREGFSIGVFTGIEGMFYGNISKQLFQLLKEGNTSRYSKAEFAFGGSVFADTGMNLETRLGKLRLRISPAVFLPLIYIPRPKETALTVKTGDDTMSITGNVAVDIYSPVKLGTNTADGGDFSIDTGGYSKVLDSGALGFDLTLGAEYPLAPILDAGILVSHIPVALSRLTYQAQMKANFGFNDQDSDMSLLDQLKEGNVDDMLRIEDPEFTFSRGAYYVSRPLRLDLYGRIKLIRDLLVLRPHGGISLFTPYGAAPCFNAGLEGQIHIWRLFQFSLSSGYEELVWKHRLGLMLNVRVLQLDLGVSTQSQEFTRSFALHGLGVSLGLHVGF
ncbi:MAG: hypothetical protein LBP88_05460 [Treponema sp.]|jgi:hypothetical protein|nr:hypothetical protein [Treponema sp.]